MPMQSHANEDAAAVASDDDDVRSVNMTEL